MELSGSRPDAYFMPGLSRKTRRVRQIGFLIVATTIVLLLLLPTGAWSLAATGEGPHLPTGAPSAGSPPRTETVNSASRASGHIVSRPVLSTPLPDTPRPRTIPCQTGQCNLNLLCVTTSLYSVTLGSTSATVSWYDSSMSAGGNPFSNFISWQSSTGQGSANPASATYTITGLTQNVLYSWVAGATRVCGTTTYGDSGSNCFFVSSSGGGVCPLGTLGFSSVLLAAYGSPPYTAATVSYAVTPTTLAAGVTAAVTIWINGITHVISSGQVIAGLTAGQPYTYYVNVTAPGYIGYSYEGFFTTTCTNAILRGQVTIALAVPPTPVYGADIISQGSSIIASTDAGGNWAYSPGCAQFSYSISASAIGFYSSGTTRGTVVAGGTGTANIALSIWSTSDGGRAFYDIGGAYAGITPHQDVAIHVQSATSSVVSPLSSSSWPPAPPSGDTAALLLSGSDTSSAANPHSELVYDLGNALSPYISGSGPGPALSAPLDLSFWVFVPDSSHSGYSSFSTHFSVDAILSDTNTIDQEVVTLHAWA